jgi:hypothetical protein
MIFFEKNKVLGVEPNRVLNILEGISGGKKKMSGRLFFDKSNKRSIKLETAVT